MIQNISQLRRLTFRYKANAEDDWTVINFTEDDLGQDSTMTFNVSPRMAERSSQVGTTSKPIDGTFDALSASVTMLADTWESLGKALRRWTAATYDGATTGNGQLLFGESGNLCGDGIYVSVISQGVCDDGSSGDVEFTRCFPVSSDDIEVGTSETGTFTINLNPQIYNASLHSSDGYPQYTARVGDNSTTEKQRLNVLTGEYEAVGESA